DPGGVDRAGDRGQVPGEGRRDVGPVGEDDDADAVAAASKGEAGGDALHGVEAGGGDAVEGEVLDRHRAREFEREHDVAAGGGAVGDLDEALRLGGGENEAEPEREEEGAGAVEPAGGRRAGTRRDLGGGAEPAGARVAGTGGDRGRDPERVAAGAAGGEEAHEEGQRECEEGEGEGEVRHGAPGRGSGRRGRRGRGARRCRGRPGGPPAKGCPSR